MHYYDTEAQSAGQLPLLCAPRAWLVYFSASALLRLPPHAGSSPFLPFQLFFAVFASFTLAALIQNQQKPVDNPPCHV